MKKITFIFIALVFLASCNGQAARAQQTENNYKNICEKVEDNRPVLAPGNRVVEIPNSELIADSTFRSFFNSLYYLALNQAGHYRVEYRWHFRKAEYPGVNFINVSLFDVYFDHRGNVHFDRNLRTINRNELIENPKSYFGTANAENIGAGILDLVIFRGDGLRLFSERRDASHFATLVRADGEVGLKPACFNPFLNPISNYIEHRFRLRVLEYDDIWAKVVVDETMQLTAFIKNEFEIFNNGEQEFIFSSFWEGFMTWEDFLLSSQNSRNFIRMRTGEIRTQTNARFMPFICADREKLPLYDAINGNRIIISNENRPQTFYPIELQGEWLRVQYRIQRERYEGWIRWRNGSQMLVRLTERQ